MFRIILKFQNTKYYYEENVFSTGNSDILYVMQ